MNELEIRKRERWECEKEVVMEYEADQMKEATLRTTVSQCDMWKLLYSVNMFFMFFKNVFI